MTDQTVRPRPGTTYRDLPPSPPIGATPPAAPSVVAPPPPAGSDPGGRRVWPWLAALVLVVGGIGGLLLWSPWTADAEEDGRLGLDEGGSLFRESPFDDSDEAVPSPFPEDFNEGFGGIDDFLRQFGGPEGFNLDDPQEFLDRLDQFGLDNFGQLFGDEVVPPELLEEFGLPDDFLDRLREGDLGGLLDQLPEGLRDRLESFEGFGDGFRFNFSTDDFDLAYLPDGYQITSVRFTFDEQSPGRRATIVATGPDGEIVANLGAGELAGEFDFPAGADGVDMRGARAAVVERGDTRTLFFAADDGTLAGHIEAPVEVPLRELIRVAEGVRHP